MYFYFFGGIYIYIYIYIHIIKQKLYIVSPFKHTSSVHPSSQDLPPPVSCPKYE